MVVMAGIMAASFAVSRRAADEAGVAPGSDSFVLDRSRRRRRSTPWPVALGYIIPAVLRSSLVTTEFRHRTITPASRRTTSGRGF